LRVAVPADSAAIAELMRASVLAVFPAFYTERQTASAAVHIAHLDPALIDDGTYFVHQSADGAITACGGWSRRGRLYTGSGSHQGDDRLLDPATEAAHVRAMFVRPDCIRQGRGRAILDAARDAAAAEGFQQLDLMATRPGVLLYESAGFRPVAEHVLTMPDGVRIEAVAMERPINP
jgi:GNAT superfamily N-acetyltransferase